MNVDYSESINPCGSRWSNSFYDEILILDQSNYRKRKNVTYIHKFIDENKLGIRNEIVAAFDRVAEMIGTNNKELYSLGAYTFNPFFGTSFHTREFSNKLMVSTFARIIAVEVFLRNKSNDGRYLLVSKNKEELKFFERYFDGLVLNNSVEGVGIYRVWAKTEIAFLKNLFVGFACLFYWYLKSFFGGIVLADASPKTSNNQLVVSYGIGASGDETPYWGGMLNHSPFCNFDLILLRKTSFLRLLKNHILESLKTVNFLLKRKSNGDFCRRKKIVRLDIKSFYRACCLYFTSSCSKRRREVIDRVRRTQGDCFFEIFSKDIYSSVFGRSLAEAIFYFNSFIMVFKIYNNNFNLVYLYENQCWQRMMLRAFEAVSSGDSLGYCHTAVRFWDLRYSNFFFSKADGAQSRHRIAYGNEIARDFLVSFGWDCQQIIAVENLRYQSVFSKATKSRLRRQHLDNLTRILIFGEYDVSEQQKLVGAFGKILIADELSNCEFVIKPHPASNAPFMNLIGARVDDNVVDLMEFDLVLMGSHTAACFDCLLWSIPFRVLFENTSVIESPLYGTEYWSNLSLDYLELEKFLLGVGSVEFKPVKCEISDFFYLDSDYQRWRKALNLDEDG